MFAIFCRKLKGRLFRAVPYAIVRSYRRYRSGKQYPEKYFRTATDLNIQMVAEIEKVPYPDLLVSNNKVKKNRSTNAIIEINSTCNIDCLMCKPSLSTRKRTLIKEETLDLSIKRIKEYGIETVALHTIGDPLANPKLEAIFKKFREQQIRVTLSSNGLLLKRHVDTLLEYWDVCSGIRFSIDGASQEVYEKIRSGGRWDVLLENLEIAKNELLSKNNYYVTIAMTVSKDNVHEIGKFIVQFKKYVPNPLSDLKFGLVNSLSPDNEYFENVNLFKNHTFQNLPCGFTTAHVPFILVDGRYSICCRDYDGSLVIGNIKSESISNAYSSNAMQKVKKAHEANDVSAYALCNTCFKVDERVNNAFSFLVKLLIHKYPTGHAEFYQEKVNRFVEIFQDGTDLRDRYQNLVSTL